MKLIRSSILIIVVVIFFSCAKEKNSSSQTSKNEGIELTYGGNQFLCYNKNYAKYYLNDKIIAACFLKDYYDECSKNSLQLFILNMNFDSLKNSFNPLSPHVIILKKATVQFRLKLDSVMFQDYFLYTGNQSSFIIDLITPDDFIAGHFSGKLYKEYNPQYCEMIPDDNIFHDSLDFSAGTFFFKIERKP